MSTLLQRGAMGKKVGVTTSTSRKKKGVIGETRGRNIFPKAISEGVRLAREMR